MVVMANPSLGSALVARIKEELLAMHTNFEGQQALRNYKINQFLPLTPEAKALIDALAAQ